MQLLKLGYKTHCDFRFALLDHLLWESQSPCHEYTQVDQRWGTAPFYNIQQGTEASWQYSTRISVLLATASK